MSFPNCDPASFKLFADLMPKYDGNTKRLNYYIKEIDSILNLLDETARGHPAVICLIKSRLSNTAIDAIAYEKSLTSWESIKAALIQRLREPRNEIQIMQELIRVRRYKNEDAEMLGRRLREILDTLYSVGSHSDKSYYEKMVIEQYTNSLDFHVSIGVRIAQPLSLESAIVIARQEESKLAHNRINNNFNTLSKSAQARFTEPINSTNQPRNIFKPNISPIQNRQSNTTPIPKQNNWTPEYKQQWTQSMLPWNNRPTNSSGNFRNNIPQQQQVNPMQKVSDVTMRSVSKPQKPTFAAEELFYAGSPGENEEYGYVERDPYNDEQGQYRHWNTNQQEYQPPMEDTVANQDFFQGQEIPDQG